MKIQIATKDDLQRVTDLCAMGIDELDNPDYPPVEKDVLANTVYKNYMTAPCFVVVDENNIVGCASLALNSFGWSQKPFINTLMVYILPSHRNFAILKKLYAAIKKFAKLQGVLYCDTYLGIDKIDARLRLSSRLNLKNAGIFLTYRG